MAQVIVVGSVNADYAVRIGHLPQPGETVTGGTLAVMQGGKGANQAHAAARLGAAVSFVAAVGDDPAGDSAAADLASAGIDLGGLLRSTEPTGVAVILVDAGGENMIAVAPGANAELTAADVTRLLDGRVAADSVVLACLEVPLATVTAAARAAAAAGATMVINPAPGQPLPAELVAGAILTPNEGELLRLPGGAAAGEQAALDWLLAAGARAVVVTRGSRGATLFRTGQEPAEFAAPRIEVTDTVGAGDAFNGGLATALAAGLPLETAVTVAVAAGAAACTGAGPRQALPRAADIPALRTAPGLIPT
ncbi:MAG TPA: PfkB family carbohydrate kinase [Streptosporangiaceae bacterium]